MDVAQQFIERSIPQELVNLAYFSQMQLEPSEHVDQDLKKLITDVLWSVPIKGKRAYIYFLIK